jgi:TRAP-type C4-dicarboxylate transport system substrate-binding protein
MRKLAALTALTLFGITTLAAAEEVTLRTVTSFAEKTTYSRGFERFIDRVNEAGKGVIHINYIGGPKAMPPFEVGNALKSGVGRFRWRCLYNLRNLLPGWWKAGPWFVMSRHVHLHLALM